MNDTKVCKKCGIEKPLTEYYATKTKKGTPTYEPRCKMCIRQDVLKYRNDNIDKVHAKDNAYREANKDRLNQWHKDWWIKTKKEDPIKHRAHILCSSMYHRSKKRKLEHDREYFNIENIEARLRKNITCVCCGRQFKYEYERDYDPASPSSDRVDPKKGYTKDNVEFICIDCNRTKQNMSIKDARMIIRYIERHNKKESDSCQQQIT